MRVVGAGILVCATLMLSGCGKKSNADLIVGKWEVTKPAEAAGMTMEFTKDGKMNIGMKGTNIASGTYKVDGDKLTTTGKGPSGKEETDTMTIKTLDDKTLNVEAT
jgi:uncharacterized protein (TIGR03066 family)